MNVAMLRALPMAAPLKAAAAPKPVETPQDRLEKAIDSSRQLLPDALEPVQTAAKGIDFTLPENAEVGENLAGLSAAITQAGTQMHPLGNFKEMVATWLGATPFHQYSERRSVAPLLPGLMTLSANEVIARDYKVRSVVGLDQEGNLAAPETGQVQVDYNQTKDVISRGIYLLEDKDGNKLIVNLGGRLNVMTHNDQKGLADEFFAKVENHAKENNFYENKVLQYVETMNGAYLTYLDNLKHKPTTWNDISMRPEIKQLVRSNTSDFVNNLPVYKENGRFASRNILLAGPPGTGKSMVNDVLFTELKDKATFIHVTSKSLGGAGSVSGVFEAARMMEPCVVIFEDLDLVGGGERDGNSRKGVLNEMLNQLSGVHDNSGLVVLGSTNQATAFDEAMLRPLRFSTVIPVELPDKALRQEILTKITSSLGLAADVSLASLAERTEKFSGAGLTELKELAVQHAIEGGSFDANEHVTLRGADFNQALADIALKQEYLDKINPPKPDPAPPAPPTETPAPPAEGGN